MSEFLEILSPSAKADLEAIMPLVKELADNIKQINNFKASGSPSGADKNIKGMTDAYNAQGTSLKTLADRINEVATNQNKLTSRKKEAVTAEEALTKSVNNAWNAQDKKAKQLTEEERAYNKVLAKQREVTKNIRDLVVETGKETEAVKKLQTQLDALNTELLQAEQASKKYAMGASSLATPVLLYAEAQKKATQATKEANAEKAKSNAMISKQMTGSMVESVNAIGKPTESLKRMNDYYRELEKTTAAEAKAVTANQNLNRAYVQLTANREKAKNKLQDLIASERASNAEIRKAQKEFDVLNKKVAAADKAVGRFSDANRKINGLASSVGNLMTAFGIGTGLYLAVDIVKGIYDTTKALQSMDLALKMVSETQEKYAANTAFITTISEKWGLELKSTTEQFTKFYADAKGKLSESQIEETFEGIAKAGSVMGLSLEKQQSAFTAFQQMLSKGTIQAQELKLQLGDALPGSIKVATAAYQKLHPELKVTEALLYKHMEQGKLISSEMIPEMVKGYQKLYGIENVNNIETLAAAQNRLQNSWTELVKSMNDNPSGGLTQFITGAMSILDSFIDKITELNTSWDNLAIKSGDKGTEIGNNIFKTIVDYAKKNGKDLQKELGYTIDNANKKLEELKWEESLLVDDINEQAAKENTVAFRIARASNLGLMQTPSDIMQQKRVDLAKEIKIQRAIVKSAIEYKSKESLIKNTPKPNGEGKEKVYRPKRERKEIDFTEAISGIELLKAENERELALLEERMNNEETSFDDRLKLRTEFSLKSLEILDDELEKEKAIINKKGVEDLNTVDRGLRNGDIKSTEEAEKQRVAIRNRVNNELATSDIKFSEKWQSLMDADADYYKKIQRQKRDIADETASILLSIEKDKFDRIVKNEELGINYSLKARQKAFDASLALSRKELDIEHIKAIARANPDEYDKINASYNKANIALNNLISPTKEAGEATRKLIESLSDGQLDKALDNIGLKSAKNFLDFKMVTDKTGTHLQSTFGKMMEDAKETESQLDDLAIAFNAIGNVAIEAMAIADEAAQQRHQNALNRLEREKETSMKFAGDSAAAKTKIEADYDRKKQVLEKKEFKRKQKMALANIAINTAMGVMSVMSTGGGTAYADFGISAGILSAIVIALGAVQAGMVLAQKPPEYWKGTDNAEAGLAWTQERGAEIVLDKHNRVKSFGSDSGAQLTMMEKGDKVKTASETKKLMFDNGLNSILSDNGIKQAKIEIVNKGLTVDEMDMVIGKHFANIQTNHTSFDQRGIQQWSEKNGNRTIRNANRGSGIGFRV